VIAAVSAVVDPGSVGSIVQYRLGTGPRRGLRFEDARGGPPPLAGFAKRAIDAVVAFLLLVFLSPLMAVIAVAIRLDSPGPATITQNRLGRNGRRFGMYKFRSMVVDADSLLPSIWDLNEHYGPLFKARRDPRCTRVGTLIRRFSLDELPQLLNVLEGEMSLVGPRPPFEREIENDFVRQRRRLKFPPGMTGLWQVSGRSELGYEQMINLDLSYVHGWSLGLDLRILAATVPAVLGGRGAY
jgi:lipopolysaccharide/colanic/teichoic acid biosynthesis glycosyltransferase